MTAAYHPPLDDMRFALQACARLDAVLGLPVYNDLDRDILDTILEEAARFAGEVLSPLNATGDRQGSTLHNTSVKTPAGFREAYQAFVANGWNAAPVATKHGGQGLPAPVSTLLGEMWHGANMAFGLCPMLTQSAIELLSGHGSEALKDTYLPKLVSGEWAGTMCMTEPQAGSDVGAVRTRATPQGDHYLIHGTKIFITYGEHDFTDNIIHMVLARLPDAPAGTKGLSLFLMPKFLGGGARNDVQCVSLEHKMGLAASPTCVMAFGEKEGATGYLIGEKNQGMMTMFAMMNPARFAVGLEAIGVAGYAHQLAVAYAGERVQGKVAGKVLPIAQHPDVARMLLELRAHSEALRALALYTAGYMDIAKHHADETARKEAKARVDLLIPVVKSHGSGTSFAMCSTAMQVAGGMGYIEEAGLSQLLRDVRVTMIYEGTNGIQALDLVQRKLPMQDYKVVRGFLSNVWQCAVRCAQAGDPVLKKIGMQLQDGCQQLDTATVWIQQRQSDGATDVEALRQVQFGASSYLTLFGLVAEGYMLALSAQEAAKSTSFAADFLRRKMDTAMFFMNYLLPEAQSLKARILNAS